MRNLLVLALGLSLAACTVGDSGTPPLGGGEGDGDEHEGGGTGSGSGVEGEGEGVSGEITADVVWSGAMRVKGTTYIKPGVTVTVEPGAALTFAVSGGLIVEGTLTIAGTSAAKVNLTPEAGYWAGIEVTGTLNMTYAIQQGGSLRTRNAGTLNIVDSKMWGASGDFIIANGGTINIDHSNVGPDPGVVDSTHCQLHINQGVGAIKINNSNINGAPYGLMFYGGVNADFKNNNWYTNNIDVDTQMGSPVSGDFSGGYFDGSPPTAANGSTITAANLANAPLADAGPRP